MWYDKIGWIKYHLTHMIYFIILYFHSTNKLMPRQFVQEFVAVSSLFLIRDLTLIVKRQKKNRFQYTR